VDRLGHLPCSLLPESSWEGFDARTSGSSCPCHGTTERIASQAGTGHDAPSVTGGASTDRVVGGGGHSSEQIVGKLAVTRPMVRKWRRRWSASQDQRRVVEGEESDSAVQSRTCEILADAPDAPGAVVRPTSAQSRSSKLSPSPANILRPRNGRSTTGHPERWPASLCAEGLSKASPPDLWIVL